MIRRAAVESMFTNASIAPRTICVASTTICDTGLGMSDEELALVFEPYVQFDNSLSREHKGTGLGMPISREMARAMGGDLGATSEPGVGSTFTLTLPLERRSVPA